MAGQSTRVSSVRSVLDMALGPYEAAAIMGVSNDKPRAMCDRGWIIGRQVNNPGSRRYLIYDGASCQANFEAYDAKLIDRGGKNDRRPRAHVHEREPMIERLRQVTARIAFDDAISVGEAAKLLRVTVSWVPTLAEQGEIVGRLLCGRVSSKSKRSTDRIWIVSRRSCLENVARSRVREHSGPKRGRPRRSQ